MARSFAASSTEYLQVDACPITSFPVTWCCWWYPTNELTQSEFFFMGDKDSDVAWAALGSRRDGTVFKPRLRLRDGSNHYYLWGPQIYENTWYHIAGRLTSSTDTDLFTGGVKTDGNLDTEAGIGSWDRITIGRLGDSTPSNASDGYIAHGAIWSASLYDDEIASLATGEVPLSVRPISLEAFWPWFRDEDQDWVGGYDLTAYNTPSIAAHPPRVTYRLMPTPVAAALAAVIVPLTDHHYRMLRA